jgi:hypothetical protein
MMETITLYLDARTRKRKRGRALLAGAIAAITVYALANRPQREGSVEPPRADTVEKVRVITTTVVQIERVPASCEQFGPPAPERNAEELRTRGTRGARSRRLRRPPTVSPSRLSFLSPGWEPVAIINPYDVPIRIRHIAVRGEARRDFEIIGSAQCIGTLRPGERCRFSVFGRPARRRSDQAGSDAAMRIEIHHDAGSQPLVILATTGG